MWWPAALALAALAVSSVAPRPYDDGGLGSLTFGIIYTLGAPFAATASFIARQLGPGHGGLIWPLAIPLSLLYFLFADWLVQRIARRRAQTRTAEM
jgi:lipopolysaccharide export LptBFGC system permease protein LptF